jgi:hypothetical protein
MQFRVFAAEPPLLPQTLPAAAAAAGHQVLLLG